MEPRGTVSHTAMAMDPVHGIQSSFGSTDVTLTTQRGAVLMNSYGSESMGEVSLGTASMAFTGQRSQAGDAARQPFSVNDSALSGHSSPSHFTRLPYMGIPPWKWKWGRPWSAPSGPRPCRTQGAFPFRVSLACPGPSRLSRESGHPRDSPAPLWGPGNFQGRGKRQPSGRHRPSTLVELGRCPTGQRPP